MKELVETYTLMKIRSHVVDDDPGELEEITLLGSSLSCIVCVCVCVQKLIYMFQKLRSLLSQIPKSRDVKDPCINRFGMCIEPRHSLPDYKPPLHHL